MEGKKQELERRMLSGEPFTYAQMCTFAAVLGLPNENSMGGRIVDPMIQRLRKKGLISFERKGRSVVWKAASAA